MVGAMLTKLPNIGYISKPHYYHAMEIFNGHIINDNSMNVLDSSAFLQDIKNLVILS